ncbi:DUF72 domain-containing protein [Roseateles amylovorans]|uniref:DUF72 domain-containing protein n=1 Tax=Roseateles amylovorans TaxID=2978473 RepID=A0ABY6AW12_9BURK|nr:DUF72 domain-containing protein [Roseateles amylovorans]UXH76584.1 DUF72 domain-containing protein [Roseateles amylovorans]
MSTSTSSAVSTQRRRRGHRPAPGANDASNAASPASEGASDTSHKSTAKSTGESTAKSTARSNHGAMPHLVGASRTHIGTAGWSIPRASADAFPAEGSHLARFAQVLHCAEINTSFYRRHRPDTYVRWAEETPPHFRFAVKLPRAITHEGALRRARQPLAQFLDEVSGLGSKLAVLLVQLPPSMAFESRPVRTFFDLLRQRFDGAVVCEPRHASWFQPKADALLVAMRVGRVAADPAREPAAALPGGWLGPHGDGAGAVIYHRWHGSPRVYWSRYDAAWLNERALAWQQWPDTADRWAIFDNTASGEAVPNALEFRTMVSA